MGCGIYKKKYFIKVSVWCDSWSDYPKEVVLARQFYYISTILEWANEVIACAAEFIVVRPILDNASTAASILRSSLCSLYGLYENV